MLWAITAAAAAAPLAGCTSGPSATDRARSLVREHHEDAAIRLLRSRLVSNPDDEAARKLLARVLALTGDLVAARREVEALAGRLGPGDPAPYIELGRVFELAHRYEDALSAYDQAAEVAPQRSDGPREGGMRAARWGESEQAVPRLEEAVRRGARDAETWHALGLARVHTGDMPGAQSAYRASIAADPRSAEGWLGLATLALMRGDALGALDAYGQVLARRPRFAPAELGRAWALGSLGRKEEAAQALDRAEALGAPAANVARQRQRLERPSP